MKAFPRNVSFATCDTIWNCFGSWTHVHQNQIEVFFPRSFFFGTGECWSWIWSEHSFSQAVSWIQNFIGCCPNEIWTHWYRLFRWPPSDARCPSNSSRLPFSAWPMFGLTTLSILYEFKITQNWCTFMNVPLLLKLTAPSACAKHSFVNTNNIAWQCNDVFSKLDFRMSIFHNEIFVAKNCTKHLTLPLPSASSWYWNFCMSCCWLLISTPSLPLAQPNLSRFRLAVAAQPCGFHVSSLPASFYSMPQW